MASFLRRAAARAQEAVASLLGSDGTTDGDNDDAVLDRQGFSVKREGACTCAASRQRYDRGETR